MRCYLRTVSNALKRATRTTLFAIAKEYLLYGYTGTSNLSTEHHPQVLITINRMTK